MITEQQQREAYEWRYPELKGKNWKIQDVGAWGGLSALDMDMDIAPLPRTITRLPPLYTNGQPDMNTWCYEFVPKIQADNVTVEFVAPFGAGGYWVISESITRGRDPFSMADPYAAFIQWREAQ